MSGVATAARPGTWALWAAGLVLLGGEPFPTGEAWFTAGHTPRAALLALLALGTLAVAALAWRGVPALGRGLGPALLPLAIAGWSALRGPAGVDADAWYRALAGWGALAFLPLAWWGLGPHGPGGGRVLRALLVAGLVAAGLGLLGAALGRPAVGPFGRAGVAGAVYAALLPVAAFGPPLGGRGGRWRLAAAALLGGALLATGSRTALVAAAAGLGVAAWCGARSPARRRWLGRGIAAAALGGLGLGIGVLGGWIGVPGSQRTVEVRLGLVRSAVRLIEASPWRGAGLGAYPTAALRERDPVEARLEPGRRPFHAHNDPLHVAVEGGLPALGLLVAWWGWLTWLAVRARGGGRGPAAGGAGVLAAIGVAGLGDGVLVDPAPVLLAAGGVWALLHVGAKEERRGADAGAPPDGAAAAAGAGGWSRGGALALAGLGLAGLLVVGATLLRHAVADFALMRYVAGRAAGPGGPQARAWLRDVCLHWRPGHPRAWHLLGVERAQAGRLAGAREALREAVRGDPALTEARLDLSQAYAQEDRQADALEVLQEAARHDPRRYEVWRRQAEIVAGPEPVPGDALPEIDRLAARRLLNEAAARAPAPWIALADDAWFWRRVGDLDLAGSALREALAHAPGGTGGGGRPPAEVLYESFRLAEWEARAPALVLAGILLEALRAQPAPAARLRAEAERFLDLGDARLDAARQTVDAPEARVDDAPARRAYDAAAVRLTALLHAGLAQAPEVLARARAEAEDRRFRRALARYRSLLAWALPGAEAAALEGPVGLAVVARQADLLIEAAQVAARVDAGLARMLYAQGHVRLGLELLERGALGEARRRLERVLEDDPGMAEAAYALARCLARLGDATGAAHWLVQAVHLQPGLAGPARSEADFAALREHDVRVRVALGVRD